MVPRVLEAWSSVESEVRTCSFRGMVVTVSVPVPGLPHVVALGLERTCPVETLEWSSFGVVLLGVESNFAPVLAVLALVLGVVLVLEVVLVLGVGSLEVMPDPWQVSGSDPDCGLGPFPVFLETSLFLGSGLRPVLAPRSLQ